MKTVRLGGTGRVYALWLSSSTAQRYGASVQALTVSLIAYALTGSTQVAGVLATLRGLLSFILPLCGGVIIDRWDRRVLMIARGLANIAVWGVALVLFLSGGLTVAAFATFVLLDGVIEGLLGGAAEAALRSIVDKEVYARARAVNEARDASAQLIGSPLAGFLFSLWAFGAILFGVVMDVLATITAALLPSLAPQHVTPGDEAVEGSAQVPTSLLREALAGLRWIARHRVIAVMTGLCVLSSFGGFLYMSLVQLYLIAQGTTATRVGLIATAEALGVLLGAPLATWCVGRIRTGAVVVGGQLWSALCIAPVALFSDYGVILACSFLYALLVPAINAAMGGFVFQHVPEDLQGRVGAASNLLIGLPVSTAAALAGVLLARASLEIGVVTSVVVMALGCVVAAVYRRVRTLPLAQDWAGVEL